MYDIKRRMKVNSLSIELVCQALPKGGNTHFEYWPIQSEVGHFPNRCMKQFIIQQ